MELSNVLKFTFLFVITLITCITTQAQVLLSDTEISRNDSIQELIIRGIRPVYSLNSPSPVQMMSGRALERLNCQSVADAVRFFAGVQLKDYGGIGGLKTVDVRSMGTNHLGVFYDGIQLGNAQNGQIDLGKFSLDNMEAISLYNGHKSEIFQSAKDYASAGSIYLTSIKPKFDDGEKTKIKVANKTAFYETINYPLSYGLTNPSLLWQQKLGKRTSSAISSEWLQTNGRYRFEDKIYNMNGTVAYDTVAIRKNGDVRAFRLETDIGGIITSAEQKITNSVDENLMDGEWRVKAYFYDSERGLPGPAVRNVFSRDQRLWDRNFFLQCGFRKKMGYKYDFKINAKYAYDYTRYIDNDEASLWVKNIYRQREIYLSVINKYVLLPFWSVSLPIDFQHNKLDANLNDFAYPRRNTTLVAFASALSFDWMKLQASLLTTIINETVKKNIPAKDRNEWSPAIFVLFKPFAKEDFHLRAFYKKAFRMPTFNDLYYTIAGNSFLKPEFATQYNAGITFGKTFKNEVFQSVTFQADAYYNKITDKIIAIPTNKFFRWEMTNLGLVEIFGADIAFHTIFRFGELYAKTGVNYTWQQATDRTDPTLPNYGHQIPYTPRHSGSFIVNAEYKTWGFNYSFIYTGERYCNQENIPQYYVQPWYTTDMSLFWEKKTPLRFFSKKNKSEPKIKISAEINNLFNQYYTVIVNYPMPGRNYKLVLNFDF